MVVSNLGEGLKMRGQRDAKMKNKTICITPTVRLLACLRCSLPIVGVPTHPRRGDGLVFVCCSLVLLMSI